MTSLMEEIGPVITDEQIVAAGAATLPMSFYRPFLPSRMHPVLGISHTLHAPEVGLPGPLPGARGQSRPHLRPEDLLGQILRADHHN